MWWLRDTKSSVKVGFAVEIHIRTLKFIDRIHGMCVSVGKDGRPTMKMEIGENGHCAFKLFSLSLSLFIHRNCLDFPPFLRPMVDSFA